MAYGNRGAADKSDKIVDPTFNLPKYAVDPSEIPEGDTLDDIITDAIENDERTTDEIIEDEVWMKQQAEASTIEVSIPTVSTDNALSAAELRIQELEAMLAAQSRAPEITQAVRPVEELTADERKIRQLEDQLAKRATASFTRSPDEFVPVSDDDPDVVFFHVLEDGFTAFGKVWLRGQEIKISRTSPEYKLTLDKFGNSWLDLVDDQRAQYARWGYLKIAPGEWPGRKYDDAIALEDERRGYAVPSIATIYSKGR